MTRTPKRGLLTAVSVITLAGLIASIAVALTWWTVRTTGATVGVPGGGSAIIGRSAQGVSGSGYDGSLPLTAGAVVLVGMLAGLVKPRVRVALLIAGIAAGVHVLFASLTALSNVRDLRAVAAGALSSPSAAPWLAAFAGAAAVVAGVVALIRYRHVRRLGMPEGAAASLDEPERGVWE